MADREAQYDPYIPAGSAPAGGAQHNAPGSQRTAALQAVSRSFSISSIFWMRWPLFGCVDDGEVYDISDRKQARSDTISTAEVRKANRESDQLQKMSEIMLQTD
jgi:hypothetical protein